MAVEDTSESGGGEKEPETQRDDSFCYKSRTKKEANGHGTAASNQARSPSLSTLSSLNDMTWSGVSHNSNDAAGDVDTLSQSKATESLVDAADDETSTSEDEHSDSQSADGDSYAGKPMEHTITVQALPAMAEPEDCGAPAEVDLSPVDDVILETVIPQNTQNGQSTDELDIVSPSAIQRDASVPPAEDEGVTELATKPSTSPTLLDVTATETSPSHLHAEEIPASEAARQATAQPTDSHIYSQASLREDTSTRDTENEPFEVDIIDGTDIAVSCRTKSPSICKEEDEPTLNASQLGAVDAPADSGKQYDSPAQEEIQSPDAPAQEETQSPWVESQGLTHLRLTSFNADSHDNTPSKLSGVPPNLQSPWAPNTELLPPIKGVSSLELLASAMPSQTKTASVIDETVRSEAHIDAGSVTADRPSTPEPLFPVRSFASFMTPSPERVANRRQNPWASTNGKSQFSHRAPSSAMKNPWSSTRPIRHVSWAELPRKHLELQVEGSPELQLTRQNEHEKDRPASPPPSMLAAELPTSEESRFSKHFNAVASRSNSLSSALSTPKFLSEPEYNFEHLDEPDKTADDAGQGGGTDEITTHEAHDDKQPDLEAEEAINIVDDLFREIGDVLQTWDLDAELDQAKEVEPPRASQMETELFGHW
jgi:hypothetical protein